MKKNALCGEVCLFVHLSVCPFLCLSVCDLESATKELAGLLRNSVQEFFTKICRAQVSFVKIGLVSVLFYSKASMNFYPYFLHFLTDLGKIRCRMSPRNAVEQCEVPEDRHSESSTWNTDVN